MKQFNLFICILGLYDVGFAQVERGGNIDWLLFPATANKSNTASLLNLTLKIINTPKQQDAATQTDGEKLNIPVNVFTC